MDELVRRFEVGEFTCLAINDGRRTLAMPEQVQGMYPDVPADDLRAAFDRLPAPDRIFCYNPLAVLTPEHQVLIDAGHGTGTDRGGGLFDALAIQGISPEAFDTVFITHHHGDHINGLVTADGALAFPNARYVMGRTEWESWMGADGPPAGRDAEYVAGILRVLRLIEDRLTLVEPGEAVVPGVVAVEAYGHTAGHMAVLVESDGQRLLHVVDTAHTLMQVTRPDWSPAFDMDRPLSADTRRRIFGWAAAERMPVYGYHFPFPALGYLDREGDGFAWRPLT